MSEQKSANILSVQHFHAVQRGLNVYVEKRIGEECDENKDQTHLINIFRSAVERMTGLGEILDSTFMGKSTTSDRLHEVRLNLHQALGAPGCWGYETEIGQALQSLYSAGIPKQPSTNNG